MIFVGADVHVRNSYFYATDQHGTRLAHGRVANAVPDAVAFCQKLLAKRAGEVQPIRFVLESTTNSRPTQQLLKQAATDAGFEHVAADVLDARRLRIIAESVAKTDAVDARVLCELARSNLALPKCYLPDDEEFALREHLRARRDLVQLQTMLKNRVHAALHRRGILAPVGGLFTKNGREYLQQLELDDAGRAIVDRLLVALDHFASWIKESNNELKRIMRRPRWAKSAALLQTMPGLGLLSSLTILAELGDLRRFKSRAAIANYAGLVPVVRASNDKRYSGGITKRGSSHLRHVLAEAAWVGVKKVPAYQDLYERVAARRGKQVAIVAVARRMLEDSVTMLWKDEAFRFVPVRRAVADTGAAEALAADGAKAPLAGAAVAGDRAAQLADTEIAARVAG